MIVAPLRPPVGTEMEGMTQARSCPLCPQPHKPPLPRPRRNAWAGSKVDSNVTHLWTGVQEQASTLRPPQAASPLGHQTVGSWLGHRVHRPSHFPDISPLRYASKSTSSASLAPTTFWCHWGEGELAFRLQNLSMPVLWLSNFIPCFILRKKKRCSQIFIWEGIYYCSTMYNGEELGEKLQIHQ